MAFNFSIESYIFFLKVSISRIDVFFSLLEKKQPKKREILLNYRHIQTNTVSYCTCACLQETDFSCRRVCAYHGILHHEDEGS